MRFKVSFSPADRHEVPLAYVAVCLLIRIVLFLSSGLFHGDASLVAAEKEIDDFPRDRFVRALTIRGESSRQGALNEIEQKFLSEPAAAEVLIHALEQADLVENLHASTLRIMRILAELDDPRITDAFVSRLASPNVRTVMLTVDLLAQRRDEKALGAIAQLYERDEFASSFGFRKCVLHATMQISRRQAVDLVIGQLLTIDGPLRRDVVHYLRHISGMSYGLETEAWESWWSAEKHRFRFVGVRRWAPPTASELAEVLQDPSLTRYYQFDIYAKRVIFVIDRSSSMGTWARYGTRLDEAKRELIGAITALPQHVSFNMIFFDTRVSTWQTKLVSASESNKERAIRFVSKMRPRSGTASYDALKAALEVDGNTEELYFLSDGQPTQGKFVHPADIIRAITYENFNHRVPIHTVGIATQGDAARFMSELARQNNGTFDGTIH